MMRQTLAILALLIAVPSTGMAAPPPFDLSLVPQGEARFDLTVAGDVKGDWYVSRRRNEAGDVVIIDATTLYPDVRETAAFVIDGKTMAPKRLVIDADFSRSILDADLTGKGAELVGEYRVKKPDEIEKRVVPFSTKLPKGVSFRGTTFHMLPTLPKKVGVTYDTQWFNSLTGKVEQIKIKVTGPVSVKTPAGQFEAHRMDITGGSIDNVVYVADSPQRDIVRVDVPGQDMVFLRRP